MKDVEISEAHAMSDQIHMIVRILVILVLLAT